MNQFGYIVECIRRARLAHCPLGMVVVNVPEPLLPEVWDTIKYNMPPTFGFEQFRDMAILGKKYILGARIRVVNGSDQGITLSYTPEEVPQSVDVAALDIMLAQLGINKEE